MNRSIPLLLALFAASACVAEVPSDSLTDSFADQREAVCAAMVEADLVDACDGMLDHVRVLVRESGHIGYGCRRGQDVCFQTEAQAIYVHGPDANPDQVAREFLRAAFDALDLNDRGQIGGHSELFVQVLEATCATAN
jgi:hypothetical protein